MKILLCHNHYQLRGGEDEVFDDEARLLEQHGHTVVRYTVHNDDIRGMSPWRVAARTFWSRPAYRELTDLIRAERPVLMHCTNTFPLISPSAYAAARDAGVAVVQALHNYRLLCPNALLLRDGRVCEDCLGKAVAWPGIRHRCYRGSAAASAVVAGMVAWHKLRKTWTRSVDLYYTLTDFARRKFIQGGFPAEKIAVKPNFVRSDQGVGTGDGGYAVFVGRLSPEKGLDTLLAAWSLLAADADAPPLKIVGDGPLAPAIEAAAARNPRVEWLGARPLAETLAIIGQAKLLVMPSVWYETFGRTIIEAFSAGIPVIASNLGAMAELVADGRTGLVFEPGNAGDLAAKVRAILGDPERLATMRGAARREFEIRYTAEANYQLLLRIYLQALASRGLAAEAIDDLFPDRQRTAPVAVTS